MQRMLKTCTLEKIEATGVGITPASWRDARAFYELEKICFPHDAWPIWDVLAVLTFPHIVRLKAVDGERLVGFIVGERQWGQALGWIATFAVLPEYRRQGIGGALLRACEEKLRVARIRLSVRASNVAAIRLYKRHGYHPIGSWGRYYKGGEDALVMEKTFR